MRLLIQCLFFRRAHTVTALVLITLGLIYISQTPDDTTYNTKRGLVAVVIVFILIGIIHMPDGPFLRPHPVLWRLVLCVTILYVLLLIIILFQASLSVIMRYPRSQALPFVGPGARNVR
jgi:phosphatidylserine synthase 2